MFGVIYSYECENGHEIRSVDRLGEDWVECSCGETFYGEGGVYEFETKHEDRRKGHSKVEEGFTVEEEYPCDECGDVVGIKPKTVSYASWMKYYVDTADDEEKLEKEKPLAAPIDPIGNKRANALIDTVEERLPRKVKEGLNDPELQARLTLLGDGSLSLAPSGRTDTPTARAMKKLNPEFPEAGNFHESF